MIVIVATPSMQTCSIRVHQLYDELTDLHYAFACFRLAFIEALEIRTLWRSHRSYSASRVLSASLFCHEAATYMTSLDNITNQFKALSKKGNDEPRMHYESGELPPISPVILCGSETWIERLPFMCYGPQKESPLLRPLRCSRYWLRGDNAPCEMREST